MCQWIELAKQRPPIIDMDQTDHALIAYYPQPDSDLEITIAFFDKAAGGSGWSEQGTFDDLPAPRYWMPLPATPS